MTPENEVQAEQGPSDEEKILANQEYTREVQQFSGNVHFGSAKFKFRRKPDDLREPAEVTVAVPDAPFIGSVSDTKAVEAAIVWADRYVPLEDAKNRAARAKSLRESGWQQGADTGATEQARKKAYSNVTGYGPDEVPPPYPGAGGTGIANG